MKPTWRSNLYRSTLLAFASILLFGTPAFADTKPVFIFPIDSKPYGKTYQQWSDAWWQWAYSIPAPDNPLFDETGAKAAQGQSGNVWFLAGIFNVSGSATRTITVPRGKAIFFPILNVEWDNLCPVLDPQPAPEDLVDVLKANVTGFLDAVDRLECELDGVSFPDAFNFRVGPGEPFSVTFPDNNVFQAFGCTNVTAGTYFPLVSGGYYLMVAPLSVGQHTLHFAGHTTFLGSDFTLDITYHITVGPSPAASALQAVVAPNPLNPQGKLSFTTTKSGPVRVDLYDVGGRLVRRLYNEPLVEPGYHELTIDGLASDGGHLASGIYFYKVEAAEGSVQGRFTVMK